MGSINKWVESLPPLEQAKIDKKRELKALCDNTILTTRFSATIQGATYEFSYDAQAQSNFSGTGYLFQRGLTTSVPWTAYLNGERTRLTLTQSDFDIIAGSAASFCQNYTNKYNQYIIDVDNAQDEPTVNAINWE